MRITTDIKKAKACIEDGEVIGFPTETVYGLAASMQDELAIQKIFDLKKRPKSNPLIVHLKSISDLNTIAKDIPTIAQTLAHAFWPGPLTLVLPKQDIVPDIVTAGKSTVAIRVPNHPIAIELLESLSFPLVAPSANPYGQISPTKSSHVDAYFDDSLPLILEGGDCKSGVESTIVGFENEKVVVYRFGAISLEQLKEFVDEIYVKNVSEKTPNAPGMSLKHYSPRTKIILTENISLELKNHVNFNIGLLVFSDFNENNEIEHLEILSKNRDFKEAASNLYTALHQLDEKNLDIIIAEKFPDFDLGKTINDRLFRAAHK